MPIMFRCTCGKLMQAKDEYAGKRVKCGGCGAILAVPAATAVKPESALPAPGSMESAPYSPPPFAPSEGFQSGRPPAPPAMAPNRPLAPAVGERGDDDDWPSQSRPARPRRGMALWAKLLILFIIIGALAGGGLLLFFMLRGGRPAAAQLAMVPHDATAFGTVRVADLWNSKGMEKVRTEFGPKLDEALKEEIGLSIGDIDRVTLVVGDIPVPDKRGPVGPPPPPEIWVVVHTKVAIDKEKVLNLIMPGRTEHTAGGKTYYTSPKVRETALYFASDKEAWFGTDRVIPGLLDGSRKLARSGGLSDSIDVAAKNKHHFVLAFQMPEKLRDMLKTEPRMPPELAPFKEFVSGMMAFNADEGGALEYRLKFSKADAATDAASVMRLALGKMKDEGPRLHGEEAMIFQAFEKMLRDVKVEAKGSEVLITVPGGADALAATVATIIPAVQNVRGAAARTAAANNMRQILIGMHSHHDVFKYFPPSKFNKGLSWRVRILPYIDQEPLYAMFRHDEAWDSAHNIKLLDSMPPLYKPVDGPPTKPGYTCYQVFRGNSLLFHPTLDRKSRMASIPDGTSNTILVVESNRPVPWTAPDDIDYEPALAGGKGGARPALGYQVPGKFLAGMGDASVRWLPVTTAPEILDRLIHPADGLVIPDLDDWDFKKARKDKKAVDKK